MLEKEIRKFCNDRFGDFGMGPHPTVASFEGISVRLVYYGFTGTYQYYINCDINDNRKKYQPYYYLINKIIKEVNDGIALNKNNKV